MKFLNFNKALCLSPHPDDVEYSMSGTISKYYSTQFDILTMSGGGDFDGSKTNIRHNEVKEAWDIPQVNNVSLLLNSNLKPKHVTQDELIYNIESTYLDNHDVIFVPTYNDSHFEHQLTNNLAAALSRCKDLSIIEYKTPSTLNEWTPNIFVDITAFLDIKYKMLEKFGSQQHHWYFNKEVIQHFHSDFQSYKKGYKFVEQFKLKQLYKL